MYQELGEKLIDILELKNAPVAIKWSVREPRNIEKEIGKSRFCAKLGKAMNGEIFYSTVEEEECGGGMRYYLLTCAAVPSLYQEEFLRVYQLFNVREHIILQWNLEYFMQ